MVRHGNGFAVRKRRPGALPQSGSGLGSRKTQDVTTTLESGSVCDRIMDRTRRGVGEERFDSWFGCVRLELEGKTLRARVPNSAYGKWLIGRFSQSLLEAAKQETGDSGLTMDWCVDAAAEATVPSAPAMSSEASGVNRTAAQHSAGKQPKARQREVVFKHGLDDFVVGESNRLAHAMVTRMADPAATPPSNLLFIHGECGVGKTHLLRGLEERYRITAGKGRTRYLTSEEFANEYISALRSGGMDAFRTSMRRLELLCIDDIHFLAAKPETQKEFLHTFNSLDLGNARVAMVSDAPPREIARLDSKLVSRCMSGMVVEIRPPDLTTKRRIIERLAQAGGVVLDPAALETLVSEGGASIRDCAGILKRVMALADVLPEALLPGGVVTPSFVRRAIESGGASGGSGGCGVARVKRPIRLSAIVDVVSRTLGVAIEDIRGRRRHRRIVQARSLIAYLSRELTTQSYPEIAQAVGCGSHSTMIDGYNRFKALVESQGMCEGEVAGSLVIARDLCDRLKRMIESTARPVRSL